MNLDPYIMPYQDNCQQSKWKHYTVKQSYKWSYMFFLALGDTGGD